MIKSRPLEKSVAGGDEFVKKLEHDASIGRVTNDNFFAAKRFISACEKVGSWRLMQGELSGDAGHHLAFLVRELARSISVLIEQGDVMLARQLALPVKILQDAMAVYGPVITAGVTTHHTIEQLLKKQKAHDLLATLTAIYPAWDSILHITNRREIEKLAEKELHVLLLTRVAES